jgi:hypothetical protein
MGISHDMYRARIGNFQFSGRTKNLLNYFNCDIKLSTMLTLGILYWILILIILSGDIESNPGPQWLLHGILLNTRSVKSVNRERNKLSLFRSIVALKNASIICLTETWLCDEVLDSELLAPDKFNIFRKDRDSNGGGVLIATDLNLRPRRRQDLEPANPGLVDFVVVELNLYSLKEKSAIVCLYIPPVSDFSDAVLNLRLTLLAIKQSGIHNIYLMGDFNIPNLDANTDVPNSNMNACHEFYELFCDFNFTHSVNSPTHIQGNRLDLLLSNSPERIINVYVEEDSFPSDHFLINFSLDTMIKLTPEPPRSVFNYKRADWAGLRDALRQSNLTEIVNHNQNSINNAVDEWYATVLNLINSYIPKTKIRSRDSPPWIDAVVIKASRKKERMRKRARRTNNPDHWASYRRHRNRLKSLINEKYDGYIANSFTDMSNNPKRFWGIVRSRTRSRSLPVEVINNNNIANNDIDKANLFNNYFYSNFTEPVPNENLPEIQSYDNPALSLLVVTVAEVRLILSNLDTKKATGPDTISCTFLKQCAGELAPSLTMLFNLSLSCGIVPDSWKLANVIPVYKNGDKRQCCNYRPVSLLSVISKVLERSILNNIYNILSEFFTSRQHGFLRGRSVNTQMLIAFDKINYFLDNNTQTDMAYLDFAKAFDSVSHTLLIHKLKFFGFCGPLHNWFSNYLLNRKQRVTINGVSSTWLPVSSGVPQGSILGPVLFLLFCNDIGDTLSQSTEIALYADDAKIFRPINSIMDCRMLQADLNRIETWCQTWRLNLNAAKCKILSLCRHENYIFDYKLNGVSLEQINTFNDLGIHVSNDFSWKFHIQNLVSKANRRLGLVKRILGYRAPLKAKLVLYKSLIQSVLMYGSVICCPSKGDLELLEGVQRRATKYILNDYTSNYKTRLRNLSLLPLSFLREYYDLCFFYCCIHGIYDINISNIIPFTNLTNDDLDVIPDRMPTRSSTDRLRLSTPRCNTETARHFFTKRIVKLWNGLPEQIRSIPAVDKHIRQFKHSILEHLVLTFLAKFDSENTCTWVSYCECSRCRPA